MSEISLIGSPKANETRSLILSFHNLETSNTRGRPMMKLVCRAQNEA